MISRTPSTHLSSLAIREVRITTRLPLWRWRCIKRSSNTAISGLKADVAMLQKLKNKLSSDQRNNINPPMAVDAVPQNKPNNNTLAKRKKPGK